MIIGVLKWFRLTSLVSPGTPPSSIFLYCLAAPVVVQFSVIPSGFKEASKIGFNLEL